MKIFSAEIINTQSAKHKHAHAESELNISNTIPYDSDRRTPQRWACPAVSAPVFHVGFLSDRRGILPRNWSLPDLSPAQLEKEFHTCLPAGVMVLKGCGASYEVSQISRFITLLNSPTDTHNAMTAPGQKEQWSSPHHTKKHTNRHTGLMRVSGSLWTIKLNDDERLQTSGWENLLSLAFYLN